MLPTSLITLVTFLLELCSSSPVYNMQPAFITTQIGTTGRNIRNLPCVSRRSNERGVCMFAINCLKANGTHLGTCIDKFYFGSCCYIPPIDDIIDNSIDNEPTPTNKITTLRPKITTISSENVSSSNVSTKDTVYETSSIPTSTKKYSIRTTSTTQSLNITTEPNRVSSNTEEPTRSSQKLTTFQSVYTASPFMISTTEIPSTSVSPTLLTAKPVIHNFTAPVKPFSNTPPSKLTTPKPIVTDSTTRKTIVTIGSPVKPEPVTSTPRPQLVSKPSSRPQTTITVKPTTAKITTVESTSKRTEKPKPVTHIQIPIKTKPAQKPDKVTKKPIITTKLPPTTIKQTTTTKETFSPEVTTSLPNIITTPETTKEPLGTSEKPLILSFTQTTPTTIPSKLDETIDNKVNISSVLEAVNGNPATNEIIDGVVSTDKPTATTYKPSLVTWTVDSNQNTTTLNPETTTINSATTGNWRPITTPDGWVLIPSVPSNMTTTEPPREVDGTTIEATFSSTVTLPQSFSTLLSTYSPSSFKPSVTYIPFVTVSPPYQVTMANITISLETTTPSKEETTTSYNITTVLPALPTQPVNMSDFTDVCGRRMYPEARIVGGEKSSFGKWPWQISLRQWRTSTYLHKCGAALLNENWAITAAHCVDNVPPSDLLLRLGEHDLSTESEPYLHQERRVQIVASHPQFDPRTFEYDLALLRFYEPVTFQPNILPVCVPQTDENFVGRTAHVTGWGRLYEDGPLPSILQEVSVPVINNSVCESMYRAAGYIEHIPHIFICAGWRRGGFDSCEGDSGGPMVIQREDRRFLLAGVISWGIGCAEPNQPGVYTRISEFRDWINQILQF